MLFCCGRRASVQRSLRRTELIELRAELAGVGRIGLKLEEAKEIGARGFDGAETRRERRPLTKRGDRIGCEADEAIEGEQRPREIAARRVDPLQVDEHPHQHRASARGDEVLGGDERLRGRRSLEELLEARRVEDPSAEERVDGVRSVVDRGGIDAHEEVAGKADAPGPDARPPRDLAVNEGQGDRDAELSIEDVGQEAIPGIVVVLLVAAEAERVEDVIGERLDLFVDGRSFETLRATRGAAISTKRELSRARSSRG